MYIDILQYIDDLKFRLGETSKTYAAASQAYADHSDLRAHMAEGTVRLCSEAANPFVDQIGITRGEDLYVYPFLNDKGSVIHSDPPFFFVGFRNQGGFGIHPAASWTEDMEADSISSDVVKKVTNLLRANVPYDLPDEPIKT